MAYKFQGIPKAAPAQLDDESKMKLKNEIKNEIMNEVRKEIAKEIQELKEVIIRERDNRMKITNWIRDNIGPDLEHVKEMIDDAVDKKLRESQGSVAPSSAPSPAKQTRVPVLPVSQPSNNNNSQPSTSRTSSQSNLQQTPASNTPTQPAQPPTQNQRASTLKSSSSMKELQNQIREQLAKTSISNQPGTPADEANDTKESQSSTRSLKNEQPQAKESQTVAEIYSDEEWTDTDEDEKEKEAEQKKKKLQAKVAKTNKRLVDIEDKVIPKAGKLTRPDSSTIPTIAKINMQHSTHIHITTYGCATEVLFPKMKEFHAKGGSVIFVPPGKTEADPFIFAIKRSDVFYPVCPDGLTRSQIMFLVLAGMQRALGMTPNINLPHGALYGYDVPREDLLTFVQKSEREAEAKPFRTAFGQHRAARFGESVGKAYMNSANWKKNAEAAVQMREFFNLFYYKQPQKKVGATTESEPGRIVFVAFAQAVPVVLDRLNEMNKTSLDKVVVIGIPYEDETNVSKDHPDLKRYNLQRDQLCAVRHHEAYKKYASLFFPLLHTDYLQ
mmetsp:Transcript_20429/g.28647  ORF Transcript_20429/g.28647 Transcript_20429/m.28647 type:complete len:555 (+) Transcript_20429:104-1768(+)